LLDAWFGAAAHRRTNLLARLEVHWLAALLSFVAVVAMAGALAVWGLPWIAQRVAAEVPAAWVSELGRGTLTALDEALGKESKLPMPRQEQLRKTFATLARAATVDAHFEFRAWPKLGANAIALPDGTIVVTDELVALADDDRELLAVVAHELGHVHERHALQQIIAGSGVAALVFVLTGDVSGLANIVVAAPTILTQLRHSRALEDDADRFGFALLARQDEDPAWFARIIRKLEAASHKKDAKGAAAGSSRSWLQSHPASEQRAELAERFPQRQTQ
jgi:Zn-dependent protease with chaperone function